MCLSHHTLITLGKHHTWISLCSNSLTHTHTVHKLSISFPSGEKRSVSTVNEPVMLNVLYVTWPASFFSWLPLSSTLNTVTLHRVHSKCTVHIYMYSIPLKGSWGTKANRVTTITHWLHDWTNTIGWLIMNIHKGDWNGRCWCGIQVYNHNLCSSGNQTGKMNKQHNDKLPHVYWSVGDSMTVDVE